MGPGVSISFSSKTVRRREVAKTTSNAGRPRNDRTLWQEAIRDVRPLRSSAPVLLPPSPVSESGSTRAERHHAIPSHEPPALDRFAGIDRANAERLKRGLHKIEARLDLPGLTQPEAHPEL